MPAESCRERHELLGQVSSAAEAVDKAREQYVSAKAHKAGNLLALESVLALARHAGHTAAGTLQDHVKKHGCKF
jgi:hypothetical protein